MEMVLLDVVFALAELDESEELEFASGRAELSELAVAGRD